MEPARLPFPLIYHDRYDFKLGDHVFPAHKYRLIRDWLLENGIASELDFLEPQPATDEQIRLAHLPDWVDRLKTGRLTYREIIRMEVPYSQRIVEGFWLAAGGTILACRQALERGIAINLGGGFHHAFAGHGEGFCAINDIAVAVRVLRTENAIRRAMVLDCDVHHGNGTAAIFAGDDSVFTISLHHYDNYPEEKPPSDVDVHLETGTGDEVYLDALREALGKAATAFAPELLLYVAGSDPFEEDKLGGLKLTRAGMERRDRFVFDTALAYGIPVAVVLAGGYAWKVEDTIALHAATVISARDSWKVWRGGATA